MKRLNMCGAFLHMFSPCGLNIYLWAWAQLLTQTLKNALRQDFFFPSVLSIKTQAVRQDSTWALLKLFQTLFVSANMAKKMLESTASWLIRNQFILFSMLFRMWMVLSEASRGINTGNGGTSCVFCPREGPWQPTVSHTSITRPCWIQ